MTFNELNARIKRKNVSILKRKKELTFSMCYLSDFMTALEHVHGKRSQIKSYTFPCLVRKCTVRGYYKSLKVLLPTIFLNLGVNILLNHTSLQYLRYFITQVEMQIVHVSIERRQMRGYPLYRPHF